MINEANKEKAKEIARILNDFSFSAEQVAEAMEGAHRTLQQNFTRLCIEWLKVCASDDYGYDGRNEASHEVAKQLIDGKEIRNLPFI